jgi:hypothetical protein
MGSLTCRCIWTNGVEINLNVSTRCWSIIAQCVLQMEEFSTIIFYLSYPNGCSIICHFNSRKTTGRLFNSTIIFNQKKHAKQTMFHIWFEINDSQLQLFLSILKPFSIYILVCHLWYVLPVIYMDRRLKTYK